MTDHTQALHHGALALPIGERAEFAHDLLASLEPAPADDPDQVAAAWNREFERRGHEVLNGNVPGTDWPTLRDRLRTELTGERPFASRCIRMRRPNCARPSTGTSSSMPVWNCAELPVRRAPLHAFPHQVAYIIEHGFIHVLAIAHDTADPTTGATHAVAPKSPDGVR